MPPRRGSCGLVVDDQFVVGCFFFFSTSVKFVVSLPEERVFSFLNVVHSLCRRRVAPLCLLRGVLLGGPAFNRVKREKRCCCFEMPRRE